MQSRYEILSAQEIREMFLNNTLDAEFMNLNEYEKLFGYEMSLDKPSADVLVFCTKNLNQHEKYNRDIQKPPFEMIEKKFEQKKRQIRKNSAFKAIQRIAAAFMITVALAFFAQIVSIALGFDLFGLIYDWLWKDSVAVINTEIQDDESVDLPFTIDEADDEDEVVLLDFERIEDIDEVWLNRVSPYLTNRYEFAFASYHSFHGEEKFNIFFFDGNEMPLSIVIQDRLMFYAEKDDERDMHEIFINGITFAVFTNTDDYRVIWEYDGYLYDLSTFLPIEAVEEIIRNYY
jgi:hypothetical protein